MYKILALLFLNLSLFAAVPNFRNTHTFELYKDEWARVVMTEKASGKVESFDFRWTLFDTTNIIVQSFFRRFFRHMVMSLRIEQNTYKQAVLPDYKRPMNNGVVLFLNFIDFKDEKATFSVGFLDEEQKIDVEFIDIRARR